MFGKPRRWINALERVFNVFIIIAAVTLAGALIKRQFSTQPSAATPPVVITPKASEAVQPEAARGPVPLESPSAAATAFKNTVNNSKLTIDDNATSVSEQQLQDAIKTGQRLVVLDVRDRRDYAEKHFAPSKNIPVDEIEVRAINELFTSDLIVLFCGCKNDEMSKVAQKILVQQGFTRSTFLHNGSETCGSCQ
jgi:rhodanese-related sulfurtransferase